MEGGQTAGADAPPLAEDAGPVVTLRRSRPKLGRNDPCWCGSGKKYKKCHMGSDESDMYKDAADPSPPA